MTDADRGNAQREVRGSAAAEVANAEWVGWLVPTDAGAVVPSCRGEAVVVEVSLGRFVFALLKGVTFGGDAPYRVNSAYGPEAPPDPKDRAYARTMAKV